MGRKKKVELGVELPKRVFVKFDPDHFTGSLSHPNQFNFYTKLDDAPGGFEPVGEYVLVDTGKTEVHLVVDIPEDE